MLKIKTKKERVIAIDYFRGICILMVVLNHAMLFSLPFAYLAGVGMLWTGAAEMFFLLSGITFWIVRGSQVSTDFKTVLKKTYRRAGIIYLAYIMANFASLALALTFSAHNVTNYVPGDVPTHNLAAYLVGILDFHNPIGWADFLGYYAVFLVFAPFLLQAMKTKLWILPVLGSSAIFAIASMNYSHSRYYMFGIWQVYFVLGLALAKYRPAIISSFYGLTANLRKIIATAIIASASLALLISALLNINGAYQLAQRLTNEGWLPEKAQAAYTHLINVRAGLDHVFFDARAGILRPVIALLVLAATYIIYQTYRSRILSKTGRFVIGFGNDTLWIFVAQAIAIPVFSALPLQHSSIWTNAVLTSGLIATMWLVTKRQSMADAAKNMVADIKLNYDKAKYSYIYGSEDNG